MTNEYTKVYKGNYFLLVTKIISAQLFLTLVPLLVASSLIEYQEHFLLWLPHERCIDQHLKCLAEKREVVYKLKSLYGLK